MDHNDKLQHQEQESYTTTAIWAGAALAAVAGIAVYAGLQG